jgi:quercetin dioxygenase-like cupin family protein
LRSPTKFALPALFPYNEVLRAAGHYSGGIHQRGTEMATARAKKKAKKQVALKKTVPVRAGKKKIELQYIPWSTVTLEDLNPLLQRQFVVGQNLMLSRVLLKKGCVVPEHSHVNEQLTYILEGALKFWIDGKEIVVRAGEVLAIPSNVPHKAEALEDTVDLDVFNPPRADWMNGTDRYLRKSS